MQDVAETTGTLELEVERGPMAGQRLSLVGDLRVGSAEEGAATLNDPWLSAAQALFHRSTDGWAVEDLRSVEGTRVNGRPVRGAVTLAVGDRVEFGSTRIAVLPNGTATLEDLPEGRAEATARRLADENRRKLDARRLGAALLDGALLIPLLWLMREYGGHTTVAAVAAIAVQLTYYFLCESLGGQTLGKRVAGLRVVRRDGCPLKPQHVAARTVLRLFEQSIGIIGLLVYIATGTRRQRLGDMAAGTVVTRLAEVPPHAPIEGRNKLALIAYPLVWLAPAVALFIAFPAARAKPCSTAGVTTTAMREGTCVARTGQVLTVVDLGHTLHTRDYDAELLRTAVRHAAIPALARSGLPGGRAAVVGMRIRVKNTTDKPIVFDRRGGFAAYELIAPAQGDVIIGEVRPSIPAGFAPFGGRRGMTIAPGSSHTGWVRFAIPEEALGQVDLTTGNLELTPPSRASGNAYVGAFRLWRAATVEGARAVVPLKNAGRS